MAPGNAPSTASALKQPRRLRSATRGTLPAKAETQAGHVQPARQAAGGIQKPANWRVIRRAWQGERCLPAASLQGPGRTRRPRATCSVRAVRAEARARSLPGGGCAPARRHLPAPHPLPGTLAARGRERAVGGLERTRLQVPKGR